MAQTYDKFVMIPHLEYQELVRKSKELNQCTSTTPEVGDARARNPTPPGVAEDATHLSNNPQTNDTTSEKREVANDNFAHTEWRSQWNQL